MSQAYQKNISYDMSQWLDLKEGEDTVEPLLGEASTRTYYRVTYKDEPKAKVFMDSSRDSQMFLGYIRMSHPLEESGIRVPKMYRRAKHQSWLLLEDFGDESLCDRLHAKGGSTDLKAAVDMLIQWQLWGRSWSATWRLPSFDVAAIERKLTLFKAHYVGDRLTPDIERACDAIQARLTALLEKQPQVLMHRDYHSRNIMCLPEGGLGLIDFQDAMQGPPAYDLMSLLKDCYWRCPLEERHAMVDHYLRSEAAPDMTYAAFMDSFEWFGIARHLKCLGLFTRLANEQKKPKYADYLPLTASYLVEMAEGYEELQPLVPLLEEIACKR